MSKSSREHSGVWIPPPLIYVFLFVLALVLQRLVPLPPLPDLVGRIGGPLLLVSGVGLCAWSIGLFRRARTSLIPIVPTAALVIEGPYRFTRNPMYVGLLGVYSGVACINRLSWALLLLPVVVFTIHCLVIVKEERYLERTFGEAYNLYKARVRRWI